MKPTIHVLLITNKADVTTDFIVRELAKRQVPFYRFNTEELGASVNVELDFNHRRFMLVDSISETLVDLREIKSVYFRRPEIKADFKGITKGEQNFLHAELLYTLEGLYRVLQDAAWLNNVYDIRNAENKIYQLLLAEETGFLIPPSLVTNIPERALAFYYEQQQCIIKPVKSGLVEGNEEEGVIFTTELFIDEQQAERVRPCPVYFQRKISKHCDVRVTVVGDNVFAAAIESQSLEESSVDWRKAGIPLDHTRIELPSELGQKCIALTRRFALNYSAIDFVLDDYGNYVFLEINPNGQWAWIENRLGYPIAEAITSILINHAA